MDSLSAFMVLVISLLVVVCSLYSLTYMREYEGKGAAAMGFFMNIFIASMVALLVMDNAFWFIVLFEMMSLSSWFLVIAGQDKTSINAGMLYFFIAHAGSVLIMIAFLLMGRESGSLDFASFRTLSLSPGLASAVFLLAFFGFGAKAGMMPLHSWLPRAHPAAPSHASALMSGVMVKIGIFGILKVAMDLLAQTGLPLWWGILVMAIGAISALLGVLYALAEQDIKRLLALEYRRKRRHYFAGSRCSDGRSVTARPAAHRGWTARRTVSSAQPCAVQRAAISRRGRDYFAFAYPRHGKNGGTGETDAVDSRSMPDWLPRDISHSSAEWFYQRMVHRQSLFSLSRVEAVALQLAGPIAMVMLAVTGGLAVMCFVKMYGITFCGAPRSTHAEEAQEVPNTMIVAMLLLAALCVLIALSASWLAPKIMHIAHAFTNTPPVTVASGIALVPGTFHTRVTPSLLLLLLLAMPLLPGLYWLWCRSRRAAFRRTGDARACGYGWENAMAPSGNGVMQPLRVVFSALFLLRQQLDPTLRLNKGFAHVTARGSEHRTLLG